MIIEDGKFYFIKDKFFDIFKDYKLMENKEGGNKRPCYFCFRDRKFLIQNIFPTTEEYILEKYTNSNIDVEIPTVVKNEIITTALRVVRLAEEGIPIPFYNIVEMRNILLKDKNN